MKDLPANSSLHFDYLLPFSYSLKTVDWIKNASTQWENQSLQIFVELQPNADYTMLAKKVKNILFDHEPEYGRLNPKFYYSP